MGGDERRCTSVGHHLPINRRENSLLGRRAPQQTLDQMKLCQRGYHFCTNRSSRLWKEISLYRHVNTFHILVTSEIILYTLVKIYDGRIEIFGHPKPGLGLLDCEKVEKIVEWSFQELGDEFRHTLRQSLPMDLMQNIRVENVIYVINDE